LTGERLFPNLTATKLLVSVLELVPPTMVVLELKALIAWLTESVSTADPTLIVPVVIPTLGMEMVVKSQDKPSVTLSRESVLPLVTEISDLVHPTLAHPPLLIATPLASVLTV
jgi:hypothetical protein